jgi:hypothetical protein
LVIQEASLDAGVETSLAGNQQASTVTTQQPAAETTTTPQATPVPSSAASTARVRLGVCQTAQLTLTWHVGWPSYALLHSFKPSSQISMCCLTDWSLSACLANLRRSLDSWQQHWLWQRLSCSHLYYSDMQLLLSLLSLTCRESHGGSELSALPLSSQQVALPFKCESLHDCTIIILLGQRRSKCAGTCVDVKPRSVIDRMMAEQPPAGVVSLQSKLHTFICSLPHVTYVSLHHKLIPAACEHCYELC